MVCADCQQYRCLERQPVQYRQKFYTLPLPGHRFLVPALQDYRCDKRALCIMSSKKKYKTVFLGNVKIGYRLLALVVFMLMLLIAIGTLGIIGMQKTVAGTDIVYKKNVLPLKDLQAISDMYAINIIKSVQRIRDNPISEEKLLWQEGRKSVDQALLVTAEKWKAYAALEHTEREKKLIAQTQPLFDIASNPLSKLKDI